MSDITLVCSMRKGGGCCNVVYDSKESLYRMIGVLTGDKLLDTLVICYYRETFAAQQRFIPQSSILVLVCLCPSFVVILCPVPQLTSGKEKRKKYGVLGSLRVSCEVCRTFVHVAYGHVWTRLSRCLSGNAYVARLPGVEPGFRAHWSNGPWSDRCRSVIL